MPPMIRRIRVEFRLIGLFASLALAGCRIEIEQNEGYLPIAGQVTYRGQPLRKGAIHFLPAGGDNLPASGEIADGAIKGVTSRKQGDGLKPGLYRVAITCFDDAFADSLATHGPGGPDPVEVGEAVAKSKPQHRQGFGARRRGLQERPRPAVRPRRLRRSPRNDATAAAACLRRPPSSCRPGHYARGYGQVWQAGIGTGTIVQVVTGT
jgi:hypothetical protein